MDKLAEALEQLVKEKHPDWTLERIEPVYKGENVIIDQWSGPKMAVRISVVPHKSASDARDALQNLARNMKAEPLSLGLGEGDYSWGFGECETAFRKDRFTVYVSAAVSEDDDPESAALSDEEKSQKKSLSQKKLSQEFARHASTALFKTPE
jgi:hypothetical protein